MLNRKKVVLLATAVFGFIAASLVVFMIYNRRFHVVYTYPKKELAEGLPLVIRFSKPIVNHSSITYSVKPELAITPYIKGNTVYIYPVRYTDIAGDVSYTLKIGNVQDGSGAQLNHVINFTRDTSTKLSREEESIANETSGLQSALYPVFQKLPLNEDLYSIEPDIVFDNKDLPIKQAVVIKNIQFTSSSVVDSLFDHVSLSPQDDSAQLKSIAEKINRSLDSLGIDRENYYLVVIGNDQIKRLVGADSLKNGQYLSLNSSAANQNSDYTGDGAPPEDQ